MVSTKALLLEWQYAHLVCAGEDQDLLEVTEQRLAVPQPFWRSSNREPKKV